MEPLTPKALRRAKWVMRAVLVLTPLTSFYMMQFIFGGLPWDYSPGVTLANYICIGAVFFLLTALTNRVLLCSLITHLLCFIWAMANYFVNLYRGLPILPWDFTALRTAVAVAGSYDLYLTWQMGASLTILAGIAVLIVRMVRQSGVRRMRQTRLVRAGCLLLGLVCVQPVVNTGTLGAFGVATDVWDPAASYRSSGIVATFLRNFQFMEVQQPADFSEDCIRSLLARADGATGPAAAPETPNILVIMSESWADFESFGTLTFSEPLTEHIDASGALRGTAYASVFGAGTSASEFEFLTGNSMAFLPSGSIPYQQYVTDGSASLARTLAAYGYRCIAFHPGQESSWQRNSAYPKLGFDEFYSEEDIQVPVTTAHGYISDATDYAEVIRLFEEKEPGQPLFLFNVTIQNHGSYTDPDYPATVTVNEAPGLYPKAEQYLTLVNQSDEDFQLLVDFFSSYEEPTLILMFGDHQPSVEEEFLQAVYGLPEDGSMTMEQYMGKYRVPYLVWANYDLPAEQAPTLSLNFLGQQVLRYAGLEPTGYGTYLNDLAAALPVLTFPGYQDPAGNAYSHLETNDYTPLIEEYRAFQYNNLFGDEERADDLYLPAA